MFYFVIVLYTGYPILAVEVIMMSFSNFCLGGGGGGELRLGGGNPNPSPPIPLCETLAHSLANFLSKNQFPRLLYYYDRGGGHGRPTF